MVRDGSHLQSFSALLLAFLALPAFAASSAEPVASVREGDRTFLRTAEVLRKEPSEKSPPVARLLDGDEVAVQEPEVDAFHDPPQDWVLVSTTEVASHRLFTGWIRPEELTPDPPKPEARVSQLRRVVDQRLAELEAREPAFATLKDQAMHWRSVPNGERQAQELANKLASYMEAEVTPRALDAIDRLDELRALNDPRAPLLARKLEELAKGFKP
jgi:hypothetical protein